MQTWRAQFAAPYRMHGDGARVHSTVDRARGDSVEPAFVPMYHPALLTRKYGRAPRVDAVAVVAAVEAARP